MNARSPFTIFCALLLCAAPAGGLTLVQLSGTGDLTIDTTGQVFLDTGSNVFSSITLQASTITAPGTPGASDATLTLGGLDDFEMSFSDDLTLEILSWTGTLSLTADSIILVGGLLAEPPGGSGPPCDAGGVIISTGPSSPGPCDELVIVAPPGGGSIVVVPPIVVAIPEPAAALVFALGLGFVRLRLRRG